MRGVVVALGLWVVAGAGQAQQVTAGDQQFCAGISSNYASMVISHRNSAARNGTTESLQSRLMRQQHERGYNGVANRVAARANSLLTVSTMDQSDIRADLYGLCMSLQAK